MAQQGRIKSPKQLQLRRWPVQSQQGGFGHSGQTQHQQKDMSAQKNMGAHPAYGKPARDPDGKDEDYGNRGLERQAGTTKVEAPEDRDAMARAGIAKDQDIHERNAIERRDPMARARESSQGFAEVRDEGSSGGKKRTRAKR